MNFFDQKDYIKDLEYICAGSPVGELEGSSVLIAGAGGLIASQLTEALLWYDLAAEHKIRVTALMRDRKKAEERFAAHLGKPYFSLLIQDVTEPVKDESVRPDYIVHAACSAHPIAYAEDPVGVMRANFLGTDNLMKLAVRSGSRGFLLVSSSEVYGEDSSVTEWKEDMSGHTDPVNPRNCYGESKRAAEALCSSYSKQYGIRTVSVRPGHVYGPAMTRTNSRADAQFFRNALAGENILMKSPGLQMRSYQYSADTVCGILTALVRGESMNAYNIANPASNVTIRDFAEAIAREAGVEIEFSDPDFREKSGYSLMSRSVLNIDKLRSLGWEPGIGLEEGVRRTAAILKGCGY
ncbi:MAG: NAD-dependent epimerase/dehydratase family protein [Firmicutes bacterium]|nr:NAD-dependent epimerase/dehydratase family protein [Bacillota bacterium]